MIQCKLKGCDEIISGRSDKAFCCDNHRSKHNNALNKQLFSKMTIRLNNTKSTYKCLQLLYPLSNGTIPLNIETMYSNKFKRETYYNIRHDKTDPNGKWFCIEDYCYRQITTEEFLITKIKN
jgi:hypothetical protein